MTKIIFFDIDGTLVSFKTHTILQSTLDVIHNVRENGIKVWIATGRPKILIDNLAALEYDGIMSCNGAHCETSDGKVIHSLYVKREDVEKMLKEQEKNRMTVAYVGNNNAVICAPNGLNKEVSDLFKLLNINMPKEGKPEDVLSFEVMQLIAFFTKDEEKHIMNDILTGCESNRWHPIFADCVAKGANKGTGMDAIIKYYGIDLNDTMAFGDGGNDISMIKHAAIGVAMGNASDDVKAAADIVTTSVDDDGVAHILNRMI